jgi:hypothetical protein
VSRKQESPDIEKQLQVLDVSIVDVRSHLEALRRHSHSVERALLQLRSEARPPPPQVSEGAIALLTGHADEMHREWAMLGDIIRDLKTGSVGLSDDSDTSERRSGLDRRHAEVSA